MFNRAQLPTSQLQFGRWQCKLHSILAPSLTPISLQMAGVTPMQSFLGFGMGQIFVYSRGLHGSVFPSKFGGLLRSFTPELSSQRRV